MSALTLLAFAVAAFVLWHFIPKRHAKPPQASPKYKFDPRIVSHEPQWKSFVEEHCESPAETAFLTAMIAAFDLRPQHGSLMAENVRLDFQVAEGRYRVDFLMNTWLVVEIDGAAYHSSPEAVARDEIRDRHLESLGYSVLRLPAKLVFQTPSLAVEKVKTAMAIGKRPIQPLPNEQASSNGFARLAQTGSKLAEGARLADQKRTVKAALAAAELAMNSEKKAIGFALSFGAQKMDHERWLSGLDASGRECYEQSLKDIEAIVGSEPDRSHTSNASSFSPDDMANRIAFLRPPPTGDEIIDRQVDHGFSRMAEQRRSVFQSTKRSIELNPEIRPHVHEILVGVGRTDIWVHIS